MDAATIKKILHEELGIKKEIIALKQVREEPSHLVIMLENLEESKK